MSQLVVFFSNLNVISLNKERKFDTELTVTKFLRRDQCWLQNELDPFVAFSFKQWWLHVLSCSGT